MGRAQGALDGTLVLEWKDTNAVGNTLETYGKDIAMMLMEAYPANSGGQFPLPGYVERVQAPCDHYSIFLCFDEIQ